MGSHTHNVKETVIWYLDTSIRELTEASPLEEKSPLKLIELNVQIAICVLLGKEH